MERRTHHHKKGSRKISQIVNGKGVKLNMMAAMDSNGSLMADDTGNGGGGGGGGAINPPPPPPPAPIDPGPQASTASGSCPYPGSAGIQNMGGSIQGTLMYQTFKIGPAVNPGFVYQAGVYSVVVSVTAVDGDTPTSIAQKMAAAINGTSLAQWNQYGSNNSNYKPTAGSTGDTFSTTCDTQHSFFASGTGSCSAPPPPPVDPVYDPLYTEAEIDSMDCAVLQKNINDIGSQISSLSFTSGTDQKAVLQQVYDYMVARYNTSCNLQPPTPTAPYTNAEIDAMDCATVVAKIEELNGIMTNGRFTPEGMKVMNDCLAYMQSRQATACAVAIVPPPYTAADVDAMDCQALTAAKDQVISGMSAISYQQGYQAWFDLQAYITSKMASVCQVTPPPVDPPPPANPTDPYKPPVILPFPIMGIGGGSGGGSSTSSPAAMPTSQDKKWLTYFLIAVAVGCVASYMSAGKSNAITDVKP
jgi:hypothetical protein